MDLSSWFNDAFVSLPMGIIYGIGTVGFSLGYRYLRFPDFTTVSSLIIGGVTFIVVTNLSGQWCVGLLSSIGIGAFLGLCTGIQMNFCKIPATLAGITTFVGAHSLALWITGDNADVKFINPLPGVVGETVFSWWHVILGFAQAILIIYGISRLFTFFFGDYILALFGTENYIRHRHRHVSFTKTMLLIISNSIISLAGGLSAIKNGQANVEVNLDFLLLALAGYSFGSLLVYLVNNLSKDDSREEVKKHPSSSWIFDLPLIYSWYVDRAIKNEEEPDNVFITFLTYAFATMIVNMIFQVINIEAPGPRYGHIMKAIILFFFLWRTSTIKGNANLNLG